MKGKKGIKASKKVCLILLSVYLLSFSACADGDADMAAQTGNGETESGITVNSITTQNGNQSAGQGLITTKAEDQNTSYDSTATMITGDGQNINIEGTGAILDDGTVKITRRGTYVLSGIINGQILVEATSEELVHLVLNGVTIDCENSAAIYGSQSDKIVITLAEGTVNTVSDASVYHYEMEGEDEPNAAIFSKDDLTLNGTGTLIVNGNYADGIRTKDDLLILSGIYEITTVKDSIQGKDSVSIIDGTFTITAGNDAIKASNDVDAGKGYVIIDGGSYIVSAADDAFHAETSLVINGGEIEITKCYEGLEGLTVEINGGNIRLYASDDGINAAGGSDEGDNFFGGGAFGGNEDANITINGGNIYVNADGDGIDSNGYLYINGGTLYVDGPTNNGNGALDYELAAYANGGTVVAVGSSGMALGFSSDSEQCSLLCFLDGSQGAGTEVILKDDNGNVLISYTAEKSYSSVVISSPDMAEDGTYTLLCGNETHEITLDGNTYGSSGFGGQSGPGGRNGSGQGGRSGSGPGK